MRVVMRTSVIEVRGYACDVGACTLVQYFGAHLRDDGHGGRGYLGGGCSVGGWFTGYAGGPGWCHL